MSKFKTSEISIIIPVHNAGSKFREVLESIYSQIQINFEVIIIDSESTDNTAYISSQFKTKYILIKRTDFGHAKTRNLGANIAKGKYLVFLSQDATPGNKLWLKNLILPFQDKSVVGIYGRQIPYNNANPPEKYFYSQTYPSYKQVWKQHKYRMDELVFSDTNSVIRSDILLKYPFTESLLMCEDRDWAHKVMDAGYKIVYQPDAFVYHSHNSTLKQTFLRYFEYGYAFKQIYKKYTSYVPFSDKLLMQFKEIRYYISTRQILWIPYALTRNIIKFFGIFLGLKEQYIPINIKKNLISYPYFK